MTELERGERALHLIREEVRLQRELDATDAALPALRGAWEAAEEAFHEERMGMDDGRPPTCLDSWATCAAAQNAYLVAAETARKEKVRIGALLAQIATERRGLVG